MRTTKNGLPVWFMNRLKKVMEHNEMNETEITFEGSIAYDHWTPTDLILREYYNNGGGSSKGFLGLTRAETIKCYDFIKDNQNLLKKLGYYSEIGINNWGCTLWTEWRVH